MSTNIQEKPLHKINISPKQQADNLFLQDFKTPGKTAGFSLATYRDFVYHHSNLNRVLLHKMRTIAGKIMTNEEELKNENTQREKKYFPPLQFCGVSLGHAASYDGVTKHNPTVDIVKSQDDKVHLKNLAACAMIWRCPVCSLKILKGREKSIYALAMAHERKGFKTGFVTLTIPHQRYEPLKVVFDKLIESYKNLQKNRFFREFRSGCKRKGFETDGKMLGQVKSVEVTWKYLNGWHPHLHILYFYSDASEHQIKNFQEMILSWWCRQTGAVLAGQDQKLCYGLKGAAEYLAKWDAVKELTGEQLKTSAGITPFGMLKKMALNDVTSAKQWGQLANLYREYSEVTKGKHRISFGKNLKKAYPLEIDDATDEELVHKIDVKELLAQIHLPVWKQITQQKLQPHIINAYLLNGVTGLAELLEYKNISFDIEYQEIDVGASGWDHGKNEIITEKELKTIPQFL